MKTFTKEQVIEMLNSLKQACEYAAKEDNKGYDGLMIDSSIADINVNDFIVQS